MMPNIIRHKRSTVPGFSPVAPDLVTGELAVNAADGRIFTLLTNGAVVDVALPVEVDGGRIVIPSAVVATGFNSANYGVNANWNMSVAGNVLSVGATGGPSAYGTFDQSGNVYEFLQNGTVRGGSYATAVSALSSVPSAASPAGISPSEVGFRVATRSNPASLPNFVPVGDAGNTANFNGVGSVTYSYFTGKYTVTNDDYIEFLNAVAASDDDQKYWLAVPGGDTQWTSTRGIVRSGVSGSYTYAPQLNMGDKPVNYVSLASAARYCNWLHNNYGDTETGVYAMAGHVIGQPLPPRNSAANYFIPTENEWYKAAYYKGGGAQSGYWRYATQSDFSPVALCATNIGNGSLELCGGTAVATASGIATVTQLNDVIIASQTT
jgi:formylglycine-generating enzyme required for sulfatase activity